MTNNTQVQTSHHKELREDIRSQLPIKCAASQYTIVIIIMSVAMNVPWLKVKSVRQKG